MDDPDFTEKTPRDFDSEDSTTGSEDLPITVAPPRRASEIPPLPPLRAARGTRTGIIVPPGASRTGIQIPDSRQRRATVPPPIPSTARGSNGAIPLPRAHTVKPEPPEPVQDLFTTTSGPAKLIPFLPPDEAPNVIVAPQPPPLPARAPAPPLPPPTTLADEPHIAIAPPIFEPFVDPEHEAEETEYFDRTGAPPVKQRNVAAITGIAVGSLFVITLLALGLRSSAKPAPAPAPAPTAKFEPPPPMAAAVPAKPAVSQPAPLPVPAPVVAPAPAPAPVAAIPPPPAPVVAKVEPKAAEPKAVALAAPAPKPAEVAPPLEDDAPVDFPVTSRPAGATVTLIDNGDATVVGRTPMITSLDPTRSYDIVLAIKDRAPKVIHVDPKKTHELAVQLVAETPKPAPVEAPAARPVRIAAERPAPAPSPAPRTTAKPKTVAVAAPVQAPKAAPAPGGSGILMVSSKPPCDIFVDGKRTGLVTPQRSLALAPGVHAITLTNTQQKITKTLSVKIVAKQPTKLIQDFTKR